MRTALLLLLPLAACAQSATERADAQGAIGTGAADAQTRLATELAGLTRGATTTCMPAYRQSQLRAYGTTLVYVVSRGLKYTTETGGGCEQVARGDVLVTQSITNQRCRGDIATTISPAPPRIPTGGCGLGDFTEYRRR